MTKPVEISADELKTRQLIEDYRSANEWSHDFQVIASAINTLWYASVPADRLSAVACAIHGLPSFDAQPILTKLVKAKVLRSRVSSGKRLYEVNY